MFFLIPGIRMVSRGFRAFFLNRACVFFNAPRVSVSAKFALTDARRRIFSKAVHIGENFIRYTGRQVYPLHWKKTLSVTLEEKFIRDAGEKVYQYFSLVWL